MTVLSVFVILCISDGFIPITDLEIVRSISLQSVGQVDLVDLTCLWSNHVPCPPIQFIQPLYFYFTLHSSLSLTIPSSFITIPTTSSYRLNHRITSLNNPIASSRTNKAAFSIIQNCTRSGFRRCFQLTWSLQLTSCWWCATPYQAPELWSALMMTWGFVFLMLLMERLCVKWNWRIMSYLVNLHVR